MILITPLPGAITTKPGSATLPFPGVVPDIMTKDGQSVGPEGGGFLVLKQQYWSDIKGVYFTGDGARRDRDGYFWIMGRVDDVINISGHRLGTMEVESAMVSHPDVAEAAVVGIPHELKGQGIACFVTLAGGVERSDDIEGVLREHVVKEIGAIARPDMIRLTDALPKTRSGKIMRRLLRDIASGKPELGDTTTLEDISVLQSIQQYEDEG